jgi:hypothetical protein
MATHQGEGHVLPTRLLGHCLEGCADPKDCSLLALLLADSEGGSQGQGVSVPVGE